MSHTCLTWLVDRLVGLDEDRQALSMYLDAFLLFKFKTIFCRVPVIIL